jgi:hypothetical protein
MAVANDDDAKARRAQRKAGANARMVELRMPIGLELDEDPKTGDVFVKKIEKNGRADKTGMVFEGDRVVMASATFGDDMWNCRGVGLGRVVSTIRVRNSKPVKLVLEAATKKEEERIRSIIFKPKTDAELANEAKKEEELMNAMKDNDKALLKKRKGFLGLW